ncbi:MAG: hypothetical protein KFF73_05950 [Cyclobacteriaceae bacterium]|nr:hypothetical protein [Cyclobacteriaceae bacterium]
MEDLQRQKQFEKIESEFFISKGLLAILFIISFSGLLVGLFGLILSPTFLWKIPEYYYMIITFTTFVLLGLALIGRIFIQNLKMAYSELKTSH